MASIKGYRCTDCEHIFERATGPLRSGAAFIYCRDCGQPHRDNPTHNWTAAALLDLIDEGALGRGDATGEAPGVDSANEGDDFDEARYAKLAASVTCECGGRYSMHVEPCCPECGGAVDSHLTVGCLMMLD
jgi:hypothetical protein